MARSGLCRISKQIYGISSSNEAVAQSISIENRSSNWAWLDNALRTAEIMQQQGCPVPRERVYCLLRDCAKGQDLEFGRRVQSLIACIGLDSVGIFADHLIRLFASCGSLDEANQAFNKVQNPSEYTWSAIIPANAKLGQNERVFQLYNKMRMSGVASNTYIYVAVLQACTATSNLKQGSATHRHIIESGSQGDLFVGSALVDMYAKCGRLDLAREVFDNLPSRNVVSWNAMIAGYSQHEEGHLALECYDKMQHERIKPDKVTYSSILKACASIGDIDQGKRIHDHILRSGLQFAVFVGSGLVDMYAKCGNLNEARKIFDKLPDRDMVSWNAMITGYVQNEQALPALECFVNMQDQCIKPSKVTFLNLLKACSSIGGLEKGRDIHNLINQTGIGIDTTLGNSLVDMYAKCGSLAEACELFNKMLNRDVVSWNAIIAGYSQCGIVKPAMKFLKGMQQEGIKPDDVTFTILISGCGHSGLVDEGQKQYRSMKEDYGMVPNSSHHHCMVDLYGRAGRLYEAENFLQSIQPDIIAYTSLLTASRRYGHVEVGRRCFDKLIELDPHHAPGYLLMSGIYSDACMWEAAEEIERLRHQAGAWKRPAKAWIELNNQLHEFVVGDRHHPKIDKIYAKLRSLTRRMKAEGYIPKVDIILRQMSAQEKEDALCGHSEKLAIAFGFISTPPGTTVRATKSLRMCTDCHNAMKIISKIEKREIIIKDSNCVHQFKDGACFCCEYD